jgi:hypothetical protein
MLTKQQIGDALTQASCAYIAIYMDTFKKDFDKQILAGLHCGFIAAMKLNGYADKDLDEALEIAQNQIEEQFS